MSSAKPITEPPDPVRALAVYWLRADVMLRLVHATKDAWLEHAAQHKTEFETYMAFWLSALYVVVEASPNWSLTLRECRSCPTRA